MSDNKESIESIDHFSQYMQYRLKDHPLVPDDACWQEIESRMNGVRKRTLSIIFLGITAAAIALLVLLNTYPVKEDTLIKELVAGGRTAETKIPEKIFRGKTVVSAPAVAGKTPEKPADMPETDADPVISGKNVPDSVPEEKTEDTPGKDMSVVGKKENSLAAYRRSLYGSEPVRKKKGNNWLLTAAFGTASGMSLLDTQMYDNAPAEDPSAGYGNVGGHIPVPPDVPNEIIQPEEYDDVSYALPLSFGITLRKNLTKQVALETGLVYTYLSTHLEKPGNIRYDGNLNLHYLGIPANLVVYLRNDKSWNVYLSGGFMVEKGLRSVHKQQIYSGISIKETKVRTSISGLQWSVNGAIGISYRFYREWSFYAEPRISYYFDTDQPISIRTERKTNIGIGAGIRYEF